MLKRREIGECSVVLFGENLPWPFGEEEEEVNKFKREVARREPCFT